MFFPMTPNGGGINLTEKPAGASEQRYLLRGLDSQAVAIIALGTIMMLAPGDALAQAARRRSTPPGWAGSPGCWA